MRRFLFMLAALLTFTSLKAQINYAIQPSNYSTSGYTGSPNGNNFSRVNTLSGSFRLLEYIPENMKIGATELITFHLLKNHDKTVSFSMNCAKPVKLYYQFKDKKGRKVVVEEKAPYYRIEKEIDLSGFRDGPCTMTVYNEQNEVIYTYEFEKTTNNPASHK